MDMQAILDEIKEEVRPLLSKGRVADYIPALGRVPGDRFAMAMVSLDGREYHTGDALEPFSIQSISKVLTLTMAMNMLTDSEDEALWSRVGREPSGNPFNSLIQLERENGIPRNPLINAGSIVVADFIRSRLEKPRDALRTFAREVSDNNEIDFDHEVAHSEKEYGHRNAALANFMKSFGNLENEPGEVLDFYFHQCSLRMNCLELARAFLFLANGGENPHNGRRVLSPGATKRIGALMLTCGLYDAAGDFAYSVGLPAKSGVGGGIAAILPGEFAIVAWSPGLNDAGNSLAGVEALEIFTTRTGKSLF